MQVSVTVTDSTGRATQGSATITVTGSQPVPVNFGETVILSADDFGNANQLVWQKATLANAGTLQSLSFYVATVAGQLRLGIYTAAGALIAQTAAFTPVVGWNTKPLAGNLPAGDYWLAYTPANNGLHFRSGGGGTLRHAARTFAAMPATLPTALTDWDGSHFSFYATALVDPAVLPPPPPPGEITHFVQTAANWSDPSVIDGKPWYNHHGGRAWSVTKPDNTTLRFEIRQGDPEAIDVGGERAEISGGWTIAAGDLIDFSFDYVLEPGPAFVVGQNNWAWGTIDQIHGDVRPSWIGFAENEKIFVNVNADVAYDQREWISPAPLVRGRVYKFRHQVKRSPNAANGWMKLWIDGVLVADFTGIRVGGVDNYVKLGLYRGWNGLIPQTTAVKYSNIRVLS